MPYLGNVPASFNVGTNNIDNGAVTSAKLSSDLSIDLDSGSAATPSLTFDANTGIYSPGADQVAISTNGTGRLFVDASGNVSIGTQSTAAPLVVTTTSGPNIRTIRNSKYLDIIANYAGLDQRAHINSDSGMALTFGTNGDNERLRITSDGKVGVGTSSPDSPLQVIGNTPAHFRRTSTGFCNVLLSASTAQWSTGVHSDGYYAITHEGVGERLRIDSSGRLGVGTTSPAGLLHVEGVTGTAPARIVGSSTNSSVLALYNNAATTNRFIVGQGYSSGTDNVAFVQNDANAALVFGTNTAERMRITAAGSVGIGTSSPTAALTVAPASGTCYIESKRATQTTGQVGFALRGGTGGTDWILYQDFSSDNLQVYGNGANRLAVTSAGNVGIGTTSPGQLLHLAQSGASDAYTRYQNSNNSTFLVGLQGSSGDALVYTSAAKAIRFGTNDTEVGRWDSSGRLLVGTSSSLDANTPFQIAGAANGAAVFRFSGTAGDEANITLYRSKGSTVGTNASLANGDAVGGLFFSGANGSSYNRAASIICEIDGAVSGGGANDMPGRLVFSTTADGASSPTERMRIVSTGQVLIGGNSTSPHTNADGVSISKAAGVLVGVTDVHAAIFARHNSDGECVRFQRNNTDVGSIDVTTTATSYNTSSDHRLKENVTPVSDGITRLQQLKPSRFNFIVDPDKTVDGFIAHEVQAVVPEAITGEKDAVDDEGNPVYQGIDQSKLVPLLTAALQEAIGEIESLKARVAALESA